MDNETANYIINRALDFSTQQGFKMSIAITDNAGYLVNFVRMDGCFKGAVDVSMTKAKTCALFPFPSHVFGEIIDQNTWIGMENTNGGLCTFGGGLPIFVDGNLVGAIGVSGGSADEDLSVATTAISHLS